MKKLIILLSILCQIGVAEATKCTISKPVPLFYSLETMISLRDVWRSNKDLATFMVNEKKNSGEIVFPMEHDVIDLLHIAVDNEISQVKFKGRIFYIWTYYLYTVEYGVKCRE